MEHYDRCPGIDEPCPRAGRWVWTHRTGLEERYCLLHVTALLTAFAEEAARRMEARNASMQQALAEHEVRMQMLQRTEEY